MIRVLQQDFYNTGFTNVLLSIINTSISTIDTFILGDVNSLLVQNYVFMPDYISIQINNDETKSKELFFKCSSTSTSDNIITYSYGFYAVNTNSILDNNDTLTLEHETLGNNINQLNLGYNPEGTLDWKTYYNKIIGNEIYPFTGQDSSNKDVPCILVNISQDTKDNTLNISFPNWYNKNLLDANSTISISIYTKDKKDISKNNYKFNRVKNELDLCYNYEKDSSGSFTKSLDVSSNFYLCPTIEKYNTDFKPYLTKYQTPKTIDTTDSNKLIAINEDDLFTPRNKMKTIHINASWGKDLDYMSEEQKRYVDNAILDLNNNTASFLKPYIQIGKSPNPYITLNMSNNSSLTNIGVNSNYALKTIRLGSDYSENNIDNPIDVSQHIVYYGTDNGELKPRYETLINLFNPSFYDTKASDVSVYVQDSTRTNTYNLNNNYKPSDFPSKGEVFKNMFGNTSTFYSTYDAINKDRSDGTKAYTSNSSAWFTVDISEATTTEDSININFGLRMNYATGLKDNVPSLQDYDNSIKYTNLELGANYKNSPIYNVVIVTTESSTGDIHNKTNNGNVNIYLRNYSEDVGGNSTIPFFPTAKIAQQIDSQSETGFYPYNFNGENSSIWINGILQTLSNDKNNSYSVINGAKNLIVENNINGTPYLYKEWDYSDQITNHKNIKPPYIKLWFEIETDKTGYSYWKLCGDVSLGNVHSNDNSIGYYWASKNESTAIKIGVEQYTTDKTTNPNIYKRFVNYRPYLLDSTNITNKFLHDGDESNTPKGTPLYFNPINNNENQYYVKYLNKPCLPLWWPRANKLLEPCIGIPFIDMTSGLLTNNDSDVIKFNDGQ